MIKKEDIMSIKSEKIILEKFKVKRVSEEFFSVFGFNYGAEELKMRGTAAEAAQWINEYMGLTN